MTADPNVPSKSLFFRHSSWAFALTFFAVWTAILILQPGNAREFLILANVLNFICPVLGGAMIWFAAWRQWRRSSPFVGWALIASGCWMWAVGQLWWMYFELWLQSPGIPSPGWPDFAFLAASFLLCFGVWKLFRELDIPNVGRRSFDCLLAALEYGVLVWYFLARGNWDLERSFITNSVVFAYVPIDATILFGALLIFWQTRKRPYLTLQYGLLSLGFLALVVTDTVFLYLNNNGLYWSGCALDLLWAASWLLMGVSSWTNLDLVLSVEKVDSRGMKSPESALGRWLEISWPYMGWLIVVLSIATRETRNGFFSSSVVGVLFVLACVAIARQLVVLDENRRLNEELERRVADRTQELRHANAGLTVLSKVQGHLASPLGSRTSFERIAEDVVPAMARAFGVYLLESDGSFVRANSVDTEQGASASMPECFDLSEQLRAKLQGGQILGPDSSGAERDQRTLFPLISREGLLGLLCVEPILVFAAEMAERDRVFEEIARSVSLRLENEQLLSRAEESSRAKTGFLANISHEIRTPMGAMLGYMELLLKPGASREQMRFYVETLKRSAGQLTLLIDELLDLSRIEAGRTLVRKQDFELAAWISDVVYLMRPSAEAKGLVFEFVADPRIPAVAHTDPNRLRQILVNILGNAIKFTDVGTVRMSIEVVNRADRNLVRFEIRDTGCGIAPLTQARLFKPFEQADPSMTRRYGGTGLGLALSRGLAREMEGELWIERSEPGEGTLMVLELPVGGEARSHAETVVVPAICADPIYTGAEDAVDRSSSLPLQGLRILVVEDSEDLRFMMRMLLENAGANVEEAGDGEEGVKVALERVHDLVVMDLQMPRMDGLEATRRLRSSGFGTPIVALTAHTMLEEQQRCFDAGFDGHIAKPFDCEHLIRELGRFAATSQGAAPLAVSTNLGTSING